MSLLGWFRKKKAKRVPKKVVRKAIEVINAERARILSDDAPLAAAMKLVAGSSLTSRETRSAVKSGAFGNVFSRRLTATYDSAQTNTTNKNHWAASDALAADAANSPAVRKIIRERARYENGNNCVAKGIGSSISVDLVGTGPTLQIDDERIISMDRADIEVKFNSWLQKARIAKKLRTMRGARRVDGEAFAAKVTNEKIKHPVKLDIKLIEAEMVATPDLFQPTATEVDGMVLDDNGNVDHYNVLNGHPGNPGEASDARTYSPVPADSMIHWFRQDRPGQHRGISEMTAGLPLYALLRRYNLAVVQAAETAADFALWMRTTMGADGMTEDGEDIIEVPESFDLFPLQRNMVTTLPDGYDIGQTKPEQPINTHDKFVIAIVREIARNENVTLNIALGDSSKGNFSSGNLDHRIYFVPRIVERTEIDIEILDNLFADWLFEAALLGDYIPESVNTIIQDELMGIGTELQHSWSWDSNELGDPLKLAASKATLLKSGQITLPELYASRNKDWQKEFTAGAASLNIDVEEYQEIVKNSIFSIQDEDSSAEEEVDEDESESTRPQPQQNAVRKATQK